MSSWESTNHRSDEDIGAKISSTYKVIRLEGILACQTGRGMRRICERHQPMDYGIGLNRYHRDPSKMAERLNE